jgi:hypothetical protein
VGLFSFVGKAIKGVGKIVGGVAKVAVGAAKLGLIPGGGILGGIAGRLLAAKQPMSSTAVKMSMRSPQIMRGNATQAGTFNQYRTPSYGVRPPPAVLRLSPVMPGGAVATPSGMVARGAAPAAYAGSSRAPTKRRRTAKKKRATTGKKRRARKLKFGSPAWRKKYMKKSRRRRAA